MKTYYSILDIPVNADFKTIKNAYRKLVKKFHPDINKNNKNTKIFEEITKAYKTLIDPEKRKLYDLSLKNNNIKNNNFFPNFKEIKSKLFSFNFLRSLFINKIINKSNSYNYENLSTDELIEKIIFSNNKNVKLYAVKILLQKKRIYIISDFLRLLFSNIEEEIKIEILNGLKSISSPQIKEFLKKLYDLEKNIKIKHLIKLNFNI